MLFADLVGSTALATELDPEVEIDELDVEVGQDQLLLDEGPDDPGHLVAVELDDRVLDFDLRHAGGRCYRPRTGRRSIPSGCAAVRWGTPKERSDLINTYVIRREKAWASPEELEKTAERSKEVAESDFPEDIAWIRSYVIKEDGGTLGTVCIYQATSIDKVMEHAKRVDMPADEVLEVADTVIIRPDPQPQAA